MAAKLSLVLRMALGTDSKDVRNGTIRRTQGKAKEAPEGRLSEEEQLHGLQGPHSPDRPCRAGESTRTHRAVQRQGTRADATATGTNAGAGAAAAEQSPWLPAPRAGPAGHGDGDGHRLHSVPESS